MTDKQLFDDYKAQYSTIIRNERGDLFLKGDIAIEVNKLDKAESKEKGNSAILDDFLNATNESKSTFYQVKWVSSKFEDQATRTLPGLIWTHYRWAAGTGDPQAWIKKAYEGKWKVSKLKQEIEAANDSKKIESGIKCASCEKDLALETAVIIDIKSSKERKILCSIDCALTSLLASKKDIATGAIDKSMANTIVGSESNKAVSV